MVSAQAATTPFYIISDTTTGGKAIASQRILWKGKYFEEVPGTESDQLSSHYLWTWYDWHGLGSQNWVMVANPNYEPITVEVTFINLADGATVGGIGTPLAAAGFEDSSRYFRYDGKMGGPLEVKAYRQGGSWANPSDRRSIIASQRVLWNGQFNETLGTVID